VHSHGVIDANRSKGLVENRYDHRTTTDSKKAGKDACKRTCTEKQRGIEENLPCLGVRQIHPPASGRQGCPARTF